MSPIYTDALVIGAGPVGLFQIFQLGLQGLSVQGIDVLPHLGGQCVQLYADKPIFDLPGLPRCTAQELIKRLQQQIAPFTPTFHLGQQATQLQRLGENDFLLHTSAAIQIRARCIFIAAGVGAFLPRLLKVPGLAFPLERLTGQQLHYHLAPTELATYSGGRHCVIHGGDTSAVEAAIDCATKTAAASVTLWHRRDVFDAPAPVLAQLAVLRDAGRIRVVLGQLVGASVCAAQRLEALQLLTPEGQSHTVPLDQLFVYLGLAARLGPLADWGLALQRKQMMVDSATLQTSEAGIYAVGDVAHYSGKRKLLVSGFHEATLAAWAAAESLAGHALPLEYTSSSALLQRRLGVTGERCA